MLDAPTRVGGIWGVGEEVAWPTGEALIIAGSDGSGKTALAFNLMIRQLGLSTEPLLGLTVTPRTRVLYLAQDRPRQAQRALRRFVGEIDREDLDQGLNVVDWPLDHTLEDDPDLLARLAAEHEADTLYVDSLKDVVRKPTEEDSGQAIKRAYQRSIAAGVETCILHHDRKQQQGNSRRLMTLSDVYGSRFITAGAGSVIALNGSSGDPIIELRHLKPPVLEIGPLKVSLDFTTGGMSIWEGSDLLGMVRGSPEGVTANDAARVMFSTEAPMDKERERARRKLDNLVDRGLVVKKAGAGPKDPTRYLAHVSAHAGGQAS